MEKQIKPKKTAEEICKDAETYLQKVECRDIIPSCDEFCQMYGYSFHIDIMPLVFNIVENENLFRVIEKINIMERAMLKRYGILADPEYKDNDGVTHKLNPKVLEKRFDKVFKDPPKPKKKK